MNVMEPVWVSIFTEDTFACIKHRGIHRGAKRLTHDLRRDRANTTYCLKFDIKKFYPSIDHDVLKSILRRKIKDGDRSEEHTSELQSLMRISYAVFCLKKK